MSNYLSSNKPNIKTATLVEEKYSLAKNRHKS